MSNAHEIPRRFALVGESGYAVDVVAAVMRTVEQRSAGTLALVARVDPDPAWWWSGPAALVYADLDALLAADVEIDLVIFADPTASSVPGIRKALERGLHVVCAGSLVLDAAEDAALRALARSVERWLSTGPSRGFYDRRQADLLPGWDTRGVTEVSIDWVRPAGPGTRYATQRDPVRLLDELVPPLLELGLAFVDGAAPARVAARLSTPDERPRVEVEVTLDGGARLTLWIEHDDWDTGADEAEMTVTPDLPARVNPAALLAEAIAEQLLEAIDAGIGLRTQERSASVEVVRRLTEAIRRSIRSGEPVDL